MNHPVLGILLCLMVVALAAPTKNVITGSTTYSPDSHYTHSHNSSNKGASLDAASVTLLLAVYLGCYAYFIVCCIIDCFFPTCCMEIKEEKYTKEELANRKLPQLTERNREPTVSTGRPSSSMAKGSSVSQGTSKPSKVAVSQQNKKKLLQKRLK